MTDISVYDQNTLSTNLLKPWSAVTTSLRNAKRDVQRWERCLSAIQGFMPYPIWKLHYDAYIGNKKVEDLRKFIDDLREQYKTYINSMDEFSADQKLEFSNRVDSYKLVLGYHESILNETNLLNFYEGWDTNETEYFEMNLHIRFKWLIREFRKLSPGYLNLDDLVKNKKKMEISKYQFSFEIDFALVDGVLCKKQVI
jgi:hypothetical protein